MSLNSASITASRQPTPLPHELTIRSVDTGVEVVLQIPDAPSGGSSTSGSSTSSKKLKALGGIWLTDLRVCAVYIHMPWVCYRELTSRDHPFHHHTLAIIARFYDILYDITMHLWTCVVNPTQLIFVSAQPAQGSQSFDSLSVPLTAIIATQFEQPRFSGNYLVIDIKAATGGGLVDGTRAEIRFKDKGLFEFASVLEKTRERAIYMKRQSADEEEGLPAYNTPGPSGASTPYAPGDVPDENPPGYEESL
ncbi:hypothetical protein BN946_scf184759.g30 [Trametes cinnabarina]|uniref:Uncharacterized protein n=1 Tax=Pycnoporus cinnabarinus TaxID=5643 RepID=A0A060S5G0_PYCCI|nr:hypothetical protein BN946_scf184759.g30 [Trametes cinnabarina]